MRSTDADEPREAYLAAKMRWPSLSVTFDAFAERYRAAQGAGQGPVLQPADLYLCCACIEGRPEALAAFQSFNGAVAETAVRRIDADEDFVREVLQELWNRLLLGDQAKVRSYSGRGPLQAWVRVAAARVALDRRRTQKRRALREVALPESLVASEVSPEALVLKARFGRAFQEALRRALAHLSEQERNVLRMHVVGRCSIDEIGVAYDVHRATAARWIERARTKIYDEVRRELCQEHRLTASEFRSLATLLGAEIELSLGLGASSVVVTSLVDRGDVA